MVKEHFTIAYIVLAMGEAVVGALTALYFRYLSKDYFYLLLGGIIILVIGSFGSFFWVESPRYLLKSGQLDELQRALETIARWN